MKAPTRIIDFSDQRQKREFLAKAGALQGVWEIGAKRYKPRRSNRANAFYWSAVIGAFREYCHSQGQNFSDEELHEILKRELLPPGAKFISKRTGEEIIMPARSSTLDVTEFSGFVENAIAYLADMGVIVANDKGATHEGNENEACHTGDQRPAE